MVLILKVQYFLIALFTLTSTVTSAPKSWPYMKTFDIWGNEGNNNELSRKMTRLDNSHNFLSDNDTRLEVYSNNFENSRKKNRRKAKVMNFFPSFAVDDECLSDDGLRIGLCMNVYECRIQGGTSRGDCALGFGACCVFETTCDGEVNNNITYFHSPKFPALMPSDKENCTIKIKLVSDDISQIRLDFLHFNLAQPNRTTGICENDIFTLVGGVSQFILCGQNSGQHIFYELRSSRARQMPDELKININMNRRSVSSRIWEIRISQIPFSSRAPANCLQYFTETEGIIQTFNFADNGRHLANQNYRSCVRQEMGMCTIQYEPCDDNSFRIGPSRQGFRPGSGMGSSGMPGSASGMPGMAGSLNDPALMDETIMNSMDEINNMNDPEENGEESDQENNPDNPGNNPQNNDQNGNDPEASQPDNDGSPSEAEESPAQDPAEETGQDDEPGNTENDEAADEGSGGGGGGFFDGFPSFSFPSFFRSFSARKSRQLYSPCTDRITLPCIVEDFIGAGMGDLPTCIPVHCGNSLCQSGSAACRIETSVTPFHIGVHFGDGRGFKGSPEENIGACLRYRQLPCS